MWKDLKLHAQDKVEGATWRLMHWPQILKVLLIATAFEKTNKQKQKAESWVYRSQAEMKWLYQALSI